MFNKWSWIKVFVGVEFIVSLALEIYLILKARRFLKKQKSTNFQKSTSLDKLVFYKNVQLKNLNQTQTTVFNKANNVFDKKKFLRNIVKNILEQVQTKLSYISRKLCYISRHVFSIKEIMQDMAEARRETEFFFPREKNVAEHMVAAISNFLITVMFFHVGNCFYISIRETSFYQKMKEKFCFFFPFRSKRNGKNPSKFFICNKLDYDFTASNASKKKNFIGSDYTGPSVFNSEIDSKGILENCISTNTLCKYNDVSDSSDFRKSEKVNNRVFQTSSYFDLISKNKTEEIRNQKELTFLLKKVFKEVSFLGKKSFKDTENEDIESFYIKKFSDILEFSNSDILEFSNILNLALSDISEINSSKKVFEVNKNETVNINENDPCFGFMDDSESYQYETFLEFLIDQVLLSIIFD